METSISALLLLPLNCSSGSSGRPLELNEVEVEVEDEDEDEEEDEFEQLFVVECAVMAPENDLLCELRFSIGVFLMKVANFLPIFE